jgi:hypothetical protein
MAQDYSREASGHISLGPQTPDLSTVLDQITQPWTMGSLAARQQATIQEPSPTSPVTDAVPNMDVTSGFLRQVQSPTAANTEATPLSQVQSLLAETDSITDSGEKLKHLFKIKGAMNTALTDYSGKALQQAESEYKVKELEATLEQRIAADKAHPMYSKYLSDSIETEQVRQQLDQARNHSEAAAAKYLLRNPDVAKLKYEVGSQLDAQQAMLTKEMDRQSNIDMKQEVKMEALGNGAVDVAMKLNPGMTPEQATKYAVANVNNDTFVKLAQASEDAPTIVSMALDPKTHVEAAKFLAAKQAEMITGGTRDKNEAGYDNALSKAKSQIQLMQYASSSDANLKDAMEQLGYTEAMLAKEFPKDVAKKQGTSVEEVRQAAEVRKQRATALISTENQKAFLGNVNNWNAAAFSDPSTPIGMAYKQVRDATGSDKVSVDQLNAALVDLSYKDAIAAHEQLLALSKEALGKQSKGYFGQFASSLNMDTYLNTNLATAKISKILGTMASSSLANIVLPGSNTIVNAVANPQDGLNNLLNGVK